VIEEIIRNIIGPIAINIQPTTVKKISYINAEIMNEIKLRKTRTRISSVLK
jgi:hypothetical protein